MCWSLTWRWMLNNKSGTNYLRAIAGVVLCSALAWLMLPYFAPANLILVYLVGVTIIAARYGRGPSLLASLLSVAAFDFFFVPPYMTLAVSDSEYILTFVMMLIVALIVSNLTVQIRLQGEIARERERRTLSLYAMSREFASSRGTENLMRVAAQHVSDVFGSQTVILLPNAKGQLEIKNMHEDDLLVTRHEQGVAQWVYDHHQAAGLGTATLPGSRGLYVPLVTPQGSAGVLGVYPAQPNRLLSPDQIHLLETFANQTALAIERGLLAEETEQTRLKIEAERQRNALLSSVSHDLRTPLAAITGAVSSLLENETALDANGRRELAQIAYEEADRLNRLLGNLLDMTRLESGGVQVVKEWQPLEEVVGSALNHLSEHNADRSIVTSLPPDLPLVPIDGVLIEQVLINLLENALKYAPLNSPIELSAMPGSNEVIVEVADRGPGLLATDAQRIFDKFYRAQPAATHGVGLGLTICRGMVEAHGGRIWAENRPGGGAVFRFTLPLDGVPPEVQTDA
jgi:two-component system, OmpR family, sensor histidine kinase KdpD